MRLEERDRGVRRDFQQWLDVEQPARWDRAWQRAADLGSAVSPLLWGLLREARSRTERLLLIGASALADASARETGVLGEDWLGKARRIEQVMALLAVALGPERRGDAAAVERLAVGEREPPVVQIAACLALARLEVAPPLPAAFLQSLARRDDPGLAAAAARCGAVPPAVLERWFARAERSVARDLVRRGCFLGDAPAAAGVVWALEALRENDAGALAARVAAAVWLAARVDVADLLRSIERPAPELLVAFGHTAQGRAAIAARGWLPDAPALVLAPLLRRRLAVLRALTAPADELAAAAVEWQREPELRAGPALALALRIVRGEQLAAGGWIDALAGAPEHAWLQWAAGGTPAAVRFADAELERAWQLAQRGDLPPAAAAAQLQAALWRRGEHPGRVVWEARHELIRDLLLRGSAHAQARLADSAPFPYLAAGIPATDTLFHQPAFEFYRFVTETTLAPPREHRLR